MRSWLTSTASLTEVGQAVHVKGGERYDRFLEVLGRGLAKGPRLRQEVPEDISKTHLSSDKPDSLFHVLSCDIETSRMPVAELLLFRNFHGKKNMFSYFTLHVIKPDFADPVGQLCRENMTFIHNLLYLIPGSGWSRSK